MTIEQIAFRLFLSTLIGGLIGTERGRHGRAAGMRTHILVCIGAALTSMTGIYVNTVFDLSGDVLRLAAQVVSGVGFLGAGIIFLKNGSVVKGLTTAAGVWTTAVIGIAVGFGFYWGAGIGAALFLTCTLLLAFLEKQKRRVDTFYVELGDMTKLNQTLNDIFELFQKRPEYEVVPPKSGKEGNIGIVLNTDKKYSVEPEGLLKIDNILYAVAD